MKKETLVCYIKDSIYYCKIIENFFSQTDIPNVVEFEEVEAYLDTVNNNSCQEFDNLSSIRDFYLEERNQISVYLYKENTWFSGLFNDKTIEWRKDNVEDEIDSDPAANFFGWKISKKSPFARNSNTSIFKESLSIDEKIINKLSKSELISTTGLWGSSMGNELLHLIVSDFNKKTKGLSIASYFEVWYWNKENEIFESFDPEVPARSEFNHKECLVYKDELVFEFYKPFYVNRAWEVYEATIEEDYTNTTSIGEPYDAAFYTITALNNLIDFLKEKVFEPQLYIHNC